MAKIHKIGKKAEASVQGIDLVEELKAAIQSAAPDLAVSVLSKPDFYVGQANTLPGLEIALEGASRPEYRICLDGELWRIFFPNQRRKSITCDSTKGDASIKALVKWILNDLGRTTQTSEGESMQITSRDIQKAARAAWSAAGTKLFKLDINDDATHNGIDVYPKTMDGESCGVSWRILPDAGVIARYADNLNDGASEVIEKMNFKDADDIERIFTDEFASLDETLQIALDNGGWEKLGDFVNKAYALQKGAPNAEREDDGTGKEVDPRIAEIIELVPRDGKWTRLLEADISSKMDDVLWDALGDAYHIAGAHVGDEDASRYDLDVDYDGCKVTLRAFNGDYGKYMNVFVLYDGGNNYGTAYTPELKTLGNLKAVIDQTCKAAKADAEASESRKGEGRTPSIKMDALISKLQKLRKDVGNVDIRINVPVSPMQSEERPIVDVFDEGGYVAIYAGEA